MPGINTSNVAPVYFRRCPAHGCLVAFDGSHRALGSCRSCESEAAAARAQINSEPSGEERPRFMLRLSRFASVVTTRI